MLEETKITSEAVARTFSERRVAAGKSSLDILNRFADPILVVDAQCRIQFRNPAADRVMKTKAGLIDHDGYLSLGAAQADAQLDSILSDDFQWLRAKPGASRAFRLPRRGVSKPWIVLVSALEAADDSPKTPSSFLVQFIGRLYPRSLPATALKDLFGLSKRELDVMAGMMRDESLHAVASRMTISHETVRAHLKRIFRKCDVRSRVELMATLQKISVFVN